MDLVLVFPLILAHLSTGQSYTTVTPNPCYAKCPPGYHKVGYCDNSTAQHRCGKCENATFTEVENTITKCQRCDSCGYYEMEIKPCTFNGNVKCACKNGYYNANEKPNIRDCQQCNYKYCEGLDNPDYKRKCLPCQSWCLENPECKRKYLTNPSPTTTPSTTTTTRTSASNSTSNPVISQISDNSAYQMPWHFLIGVVVTFLVLFWLLLLFTLNPVRYPDSCCCWITNKDLEPPFENTEFNGPCSHRDNGPTTLTLNISEETPMMTLSQSPATPKHPALYCGHVLPDAEHKAAKQDEQSEHWPAIVLYTIIKEVPLRRWKEFLRLLSVADQQLERVEQEAGLGLGFMERQYQMLRLWSQRSTASLSDVFSALHYMDLSGCAQLLKESLEKLQWRPELKQGFTDYVFNGAMQDT